MRDADRMQEKIEIALEQRQVALLALAALVLLGVVFAAGVQVGRQISSAQASAPQAAHPDDLVAIDDSHAEGTQGAAAKVEARQPPTRAQLEAEQKAKDAEAKAAEAKAAETKAAEAAIVPLAPAAGKVPEAGKVDPGKVEPGKVEPGKADADDDSNSDDDAEAPKPQKVAIVKQAPDAHAT
ncbi:MAG: hypothetical protein JST92_03665, partial [Deltaproteobacteria bacterium]|nr:hypothetical protein [Deltaproteobacteria bacterium]